MSDSIWYFASTWQSLHYAYTYDILLLFKAKFRTMKRSRAPSLVMAMLSLSNLSSCGTLGWLFECRSNCHSSHSQHGSSCAASSFIVVMRSNANFSSTPHVKLLTCSVYRLVLFTRTPTRTLLDSKVFCALMFLSVLAGPLIYPSIPRVHLSWSWPWLYWTF